MNKNPKFGEQNMFRFDDEVIQQQSTDCASAHIRPIHRLCVETLPQTELSDEEIRKSEIKIFNSQI